MYKRQGSASAGVPDSGFVRLKLESGEVEGRAADGVLSFKGIPYAAPPLGALRWQAPKAAIPWVGLRPALDYGPDSVSYTHLDVYKRQVRPRIERYYWPLAAALMVALFTFLIPRRRS